MSLKINVRLKDTIDVFTKRLYYFLFDEDPNDCQYLKDQFLEMSKKLEFKNAESAWQEFKNRIPIIREKLNLDAKAFQNNDPANKSLEEIYLAYPGFYAIAIYRLSHELCLLNAPIIPRMMSEYVHGVTGIDIHPGATIGDSFFIDHGTGTVIGETTIIEKDVKIYQGVTLGGIQVKKSLSDTKRHQTIKENVIIYANSTILGGDVVIGANSIIGANVCITKSVPENSIVTYKKEYKLRVKESDTE